MSPQYKSEISAVAFDCREADGEDRLGLTSEGEGDTEGECKAHTPDVPLSTDNTPQCLNKALEGLSS
ncbi:phosphatidate cytidylyltransferase 2, partial [Tachysurus ichikawai]